MVIIFHPIHPGQWMDEMWVMDKQVNRWISGADGRASRWKFGSMGLV